MKRVAVVVISAVMTALVYGVTETGAQGSADERAAQARRDAVQSRLAEIPIGAVVRIERLNGPRIDAVLQSVGADAITVVIPKGADRTPLMIPLAEIRKVEELHGHALRNVLIGFGIAAAVLVGLCASA